MALELAMEDDLFFADLNRQISLLIEDDDEENPDSHFPSISHHEEISRSMMIHPPILPSQYVYQESCARELMSKGTGVFFPQSSQPRRNKYKQGRRSSNHSSTKCNNKQQLMHSRGRSNGATQANLSPAYGTNINRC